MTFIRTAVVVNDKMLNTEHPVKFDPFLQVRSLVFYDRRDGQVVFARTDGPRRLDFGPIVDDVSVLFLFFDSELIFYKIQRLS